MFKPNHLIHESSPYLLQHAHNPVDWYPWGDAAFEKARKEDKPIWLSIGYSTCHWCHVMETESYSDPEVGKALNQDFVAIKVDREERPDIDQVYMQAAQMMTGSGGWPLNVLLTPEGKPFYAATYLPKTGRFGHIGVLELASRVHTLWQTDRSQLLNSAKKISATMNDRNSLARPDTLHTDIVKETYHELAATFDAKHGGFGGAPKFPSLHRILFLLRYGHIHHDAKAWEMAEKTLTEMFRGGIYDQVGFGLHRYSTDDHWLLPHFEKMLYDQAMFIIACTEAYQATGKAIYAKAVRATVQYVLRDMRAPNGGFYSAEDADSEGVEGKFYVWTMAEVAHVLSADDAAFAYTVFGMQKEGNMHDESGGGEYGINVLHLAHPPENAKDAARLARIKTQLLKARTQRVRPFRDDKIMTDWNGLMIAALAIAARSLHEPEYAQAARTSAVFVLKRLRKTDGRLLHRFRKGKAGIEAHLDDYAFLVWGLIELYETDFDLQFLHTALDLTTDMLKYFSAPDGGLYFTANDAASLLVRPMDAYDGAIPSGNSVAMMNLLRLARMTGNTVLEKTAADIASRFAKDVNSIPSAFSWLISAYMFASTSGHEVVLAGNRNTKNAETMLRTIRTHYLPHTVILWRDQVTADELAKIAPYTKAQKAINGKTTAYICEHFQCNQPTTDPEQALTLLIQR